MLQINTTYVHGVLKIQFGKIRHCHGHSDPQMPASGPVNYTAIQTRLIFNTIYTVIYAKRPIRMFLHTNIGAQTPLRMFLHTNITMQAMTPKYAMLRTSEPLTFRGAAVVDHKGKYGARRFRPEYRIPTKSLVLSNFFRRSSNSKTSRLFASPWDLHGFDQE